jgi:hypothetical protein
LDTVRDCDRLLLKPDNFATLLDVPTASEACQEFLGSVREAARKLSYNETLVIVLVGHGAKGSGALIVSTADQDSCLLSREDVEDVVRGCKGRISLFNTACFSGHWTSDSWQLFAAAQKDEPAYSMQSSYSGTYRGGMFTSAVIAEYADAYGIRTPCPRSIQNNGSRDCQEVHDFGRYASRRPELRLPRKSHSEVVEFLNRMIARFCNLGSTQHRFVSKPSRGILHHLPFTPLSCEDDSMYTAECLPPHRDSHHPYSSVTQEPGRLSDQDEAELAQLSEDLLKFMPPPSPGEIRTASGCLRLAFNRPMPSKERAKLLSELRDRIYVRKLALAIAHQLCWTDAVETIGPPSGNILEKSVDTPLTQLAIESGCRLEDVIIPDFIYPWEVAAGWLAAVWRLSGSPVVDAATWSDAVEEGRLEVKGGRYDTCL